MVSTATERKKVVVRNLPPTLPEESLRIAIEEKCSGMYSYFRFVPGKISAKGYRHSRAYLYHNDPLLVYDFRAAFDGHAFVNERGVQFRCSVEYAPYQKAPKVISKKDPREGTLDKDADYQDFLAELEKDPYSLPGAKFRSEGEGAAAEGGVPAADTDGKRVSALMQYLEQKWAGKLDGGSENRKTSRQRGKGGRKEKEKEENMGWDGLAPPPGFAAMPPPTLPSNPERKSSGAPSREPTGEGASTSRKSSNRASKNNDGKKPAPQSLKQKGSKEASKGQKEEGWGEIPASSQNDSGWGDSQQPAEEAISRRNKGSKASKGEGGAPPPAEGGKSRQRRQPGEGAKAGKEEGRGDVSADQKTEEGGKAAPMRILRKEASQVPMKGAEERASPAPRERRRRSDKPGEGAGGSEATAQGKAVRAGFQVYTPRPRSTS